MYTAKHAMLTREKHPDTDVYVFYIDVRSPGKNYDEFYRGKCDYELSNTAETAEAFQSAAQIFFQRLIAELREEKDD